MSIKYKDLKKHQIVSIIDDNDIKWYVIVLPVTEKDIKRGINAEHPGFYGFRGLWYKGNGTRIKSYGKIYDLSLYDNIELIRNDIRGLSKKALNHLIDCIH